jgi:hypothetical protein
MQASNRRPSPALIIAIIALIAALGGTAWAAGLKKGSVGSRQLKSGSVTTGKIANNAITSPKVAKETLTGADIDVANLGSVPSATHASSADLASALSDGSEHRAAGCPAGATDIRGVCFDKTLSAAVKGVKLAADACAAKGGWLPTPMELYSVRNVIFLGGGTPPDYAVSDVYFNEPIGGTAYSSIVVTSTGATPSVPENAEVKYICAYPLVR